MKTLVAFYSKSGNTKKVGEEIAKNLNVDVDEIIDKKDRSGILGWLGGGRDALFKKATTIESKKDPSQYDLIVVGTPIWAGSVTPAVRAYLSKNKFKKVAFFCSCGMSKGRSFDEMEKLSKKPLSVLELKEKKIDESKDKIKEFCDGLKK